MTLADPLPDWTFRPHAGVADADVDTLFRTHYNNLCGFVYSYVKSHEIAEEIIQELFFKLWERRREGLQIDLSRAYLYTAARNLALNYLKHQHIESRWEKQETLTDYQPTTPIASDDLELTELATIIQRAIDRLPARCRLVYTMSRQQELSYAEIAKVLGISVKTVEAQMGKALKILRHAVTGYLGGVCIIAAGCLSLTHPLFL